MRALAYSEPGRHPLREPQRQRHHGALSRAARAQPRAELAPRDPRRRDRRLRRARPPELRAPAAADARRAARARSRRLAKEVAGRLHRLRPAVARRPLADGAALRRAARAAAATSSSKGPTGRRPTTSSATARRCSRRAASSGLEGVVAKRLDSPYEPGRRSPCWLKVKNVRREDVVVGGWLPGDGQAHATASARCSSASRRTAGCATPGRVGTGFTEAELDRLAKLLERRDGLAVRGPATARSRRASRVFVEPTRVAEVEFTEWTTRRRPAPPVLQGAARGGAAVGVPRRRHAGARRDRGAGRRAHAEGHEPRQGPLSRRSASRKRDVIEYLVAIAPAILPHLEGRPLTRKRYPNGVDDKFFFEKQCPSHRPDWVRGRADRAVEEGRRVLRLRRPADARLARQPRGARAAHVAVARRADRAPDDDGLRPRPGPAGDDRRVLPRRADACTGCSRTSACRRSRRRRATRACRSTSR